MDYEKPQYLSYNGFGRTAMIRGVPYMIGLTFVTIFMPFSMVMGLIFGVKGWLIMLVLVPILLFIRQICETDDKACDILMLDAKWMLIKFLSGNSKMFGDTLTISPISYRLRKKDVERLLKTPA